MIARAFQALVSTFLRNIRSWIGCCAIVVVAATAVADPPVPPTPPNYNAGSIDVGTMSYTLYVPAFYPDRDADDRLSTKEVFQFVELVRNATANSPLFAAINGLGEPERSLQEKAVAQNATDALLRLIARPDDFVFPFSGQPFVQNAVFFYFPTENGSTGNINVHPYDPIADPGDVVRPDGFPYYEPRSDDNCLFSGGNFGAAMFSRVSQCMFGRSYSYPSELEPPVPTDINQLPSFLNNPPAKFPTQFTGCPPFKLPPSEPMPHGDGPVYCQGEIKFDGGAGPCSMPRPEPAPPEAPDEPLCSSSNPCAPPPGDGEPPPGFEDIQQPPINTCASGNACIPDCQVIPCDHGNPDPDPGMLCLGVCDMPKDPPPPKNDSPNPGMDPNAIFQPPLEPLPKEDKTIYYCGGSEGAASTASMGGSGPGSSPATSCHPVDLVNGYKMEQETDMVFGVTGGNFALGRV